MNMKSIIAEVNRVLKPIEFTSQKYVWKRKVGSFTDVIDLQVSKSRDTVTINIGVLDVEVHTLLWGDEPADFVKLPARTVDARIGQLIDDKDKWWEIDDPSVAVEIAKSITAYALPFLEQMHAREAMIRWLTSIDVIKRRYPPPILNLAILECLTGHPGRGCEILGQSQKTWKGPWGVRAAEIASQLKCPHMIPS